MGKKERVFRETGKVLVNLGSLTFASWVLGTIIKGDYDRFAILCVGGGLAFSLIAIGIIFLTKGDEK